jgi:hypothetical protein
MEQLKDSEIQVSEKEAQADGHRSKAEELRKRLEKLELDVWWNKTDAIFSQED